MPLRFLLFALFMVASVSAQAVRISKIIDANLYLLDDGRKITLANVEIPPENSPGFASRFIAGMAINLAEDSLLNKDVFMEIAANSTEADSSIPVHLFIPSTIKSTNYNQCILGKGLGKYQPDPTSPYHQNYSDAQRHSQNEKVGCWQPLENIFTTAGKVSELEWKPAQHIQERLVFFRFDIWGGKGNYDIRDEADPQPGHEFVSMNAGIEIVNQSGFEIKFSRLRRQDVSYSWFGTERMKYSEWKHAQSFSVKSNVNLKYVGFNIGFILFKSDPGFWIEDYPFNHTNQFIAGLKLGLMNKLYISMQRNDDLFSEYASLKLNYHFKNPHNCFTFGWAPTRIKGYLATADIMLLDKIIIQSKISYYYDIKWTVWRAGIGVVL